MAKRKTQGSKSEFFTVVEYLAKQSHTKPRADIGKYCAQPTEESTVIYSKNGNARNFELFDELSGILKKIYVYDKEFSENQKSEMLVIGLLNEDGVNEVLEVDFNSSYAASLIKRLESISLESPVVLKAFCIYDEERSKDKNKDVFNRMLLPYQEFHEGGKKSLPSTYGNPESGLKMLPELLEIKSRKRGESLSKWDNSELLEAMREIVKETSLRISAMQTEKRIQKESAKQAEEISNSDSPLLEYNDDLPL